MTDPACKKKKCDLGVNTNHRVDSWVKKAKFMSGYKEWIKKGLEIKNPLGLSSDEPSLVLKTGNPLPSYKFMEESDEEGLISRNFF